MLLEDIGFYTLSDFRAKNTSEKSNLSRCELVLSSRCNFRCPYCRRIGGTDISYESAAEIVRLWVAEGLTAIRFSGGEPTLWLGLVNLCFLAHSLGIEHVAISSNGSADRQMYKRLVWAGANDFSISLDACCAEDGEKMAGGISNVWEKVIENIAYLSSEVYTTVGIVLTEDNVATLDKTISLADSLGVADIRIIPAAQNGDRIKDIIIDQAILDKHPILAYRIKNVQKGISVRGLSEDDSHRCGLVLDDMAINQGKHYPCIIYMRESGEAIGNIGQDMREERLRWFQSHNTHSDPICKNNCLDVCREYNNKYDFYHPTLS